MYKKQISSGLPFSMNGKAQAMYAIVLGLMVIVCLFSSYAEAKKRTPKITIALGEYPPFSGKKLPGNGCAATLYRDIYESQGYKVKFKWVKWNRAYNETKRGFFDATAHWLDSAERRKDFLFPDNHVAVENLYFYFLKDKPLKWESFEDLTSRVIVINRGYTYNKAFYDAIKNNSIRTKVVDSIDQNFAILLSRRADTTLMDEQAAKSNLKNLEPHQQERITQDEKAAIVSKGYFLISKRVRKKNELRAAFDLGYEEVMAREGYRDKYIAECSQL
ncbi:substrate-binding periplasmic protein [Algicola sagamiensis]|uniref:substrate-binding periplasmic protein n=1 Tax=Algicola sagamiensis TaxID=163869 RepID=UPI00037F4420|nr:transporter substrate-binding domain-containing protein [Algicola sagamiensis]